MLKKILFVSNTPEFFLSHRLPIAEEAKRQGFEVHIASAHSIDGVHAINEHGFFYHRVSFERSGQNPFKEIKTIIELIKLFWHMQPDIVHLITIKPVLYGGVAARATSINSVVFAVSGLGSVYVDQSILARLRKGLVNLIYRFSLKQKRLVVIFQNPDDRDLLISHRVLDQSKVKMIRGSGVDLGNYQFLPEPNGVPIVVMASRLLQEKGVLIFGEAARILREREIDVRMRLIGSPDPGNPSTVTQEMLDEWAHEGVVEVMGYSSDIPKQYANANIVCLPSYYGEGLPKSLVEAAACGRAVITTDHSGCRDAIIPDVTGLLIPVKNVSALADAIQRLLESPSLRKEMGAAGRELAEREFAIEKIVEQHMSIYREVLSND